MNATGVVLHTNLGRSAARRRGRRGRFGAAAGYSDLEFDLASGRRGNRLGALGDKLVMLSGAEAAFACNNNASAVLLALDALAASHGDPERREVIVSRGELVEIGGSFRVPDIMSKAGVELVEVGSTTARTCATTNARSARARALLLKVHRSNFEQSGFVAEVELPELVALGRERGVPVVEDLGSGTFVDLRARGLDGVPAEAFVPSRVASGADAICFSGDKLLGGPQAGIVVGRHEAIEAMRANPFARAMRLDKMGIAALDHVLTALLDERYEDVPVLERLLEPLDSLERRTRALAKRLEAVIDGRVSHEVVAASGPVGGGSLPGFELATWAIALAGSGELAPGRLAARLRRAPRPVVARVRDDALWFDLRSVAPGEEAALGDALSFALEG